ncbi:nitrite/sulfite reductase, partial [bacterium]|nr:nitrite/sulfite reductase [bacterium]
SVPAYEDNRDFYTDWGDPREFTIGDMGFGECAGEVVSAAEFELTAAEREVFEAQLALERGQAHQAGVLAFKAMLRAARALVQTRLPQAPDDPDQIVAQFETCFYDTRLFFDPFAQGKFARYLLDAHASGNVRTRYDEEKAHQRIEEAQLFVEAALACYTRLHTT